MSAISAAKSIIKGSLKFKEPSITLLVADIAYKTNIRAISEQYPNYKKSKLLAISEQYPTFRSLIAPRQFATNRNFATNRAISRLTAFFSLLQPIFPLVQVYWGHFNHPFLCCSSKSGKRKTKAGSRHTKKG